MSASSKRLRILTGLLAFVVGGVMVWLLVGGGQQSEQFVTVNVALPAASDMISTQSICVETAPSVNFDTDLPANSNVIQEAGLTFLRDASQALVDVPAALTIDEIYANGVLVDLPDDRGAHKTTFVFPAQVNTLTVCVR